MKKSSGKKQNKEKELLAEAEEWETGKRGSHSTLATDEDEANLDEAMELQMISIRLPSSVIDALKAKAKKEGIGYQPYTRQLLIRSLQAEYGTQEGKLHDLEERLLTVEKAVFKKTAGR